MDKEKLKKRSAKAKSIASEAAQKNDFVATKYDDDESDDAESANGQSSSDESPESETKDEDLKEMIDVDFDAVAPVEKDFHGIRQLLLRLYLNLHIDSSELSDLVISQSNVGSVVKVVDDEDDEVFGVLSVLSMQRHKEMACVKQLKLELLSKCQLCAKEEREKFGKILEEKNVGYLINERFINIPPHISVPLHNSLRDEVENCCKTDSSFDFDYLLLFAKSVRPLGRGERSSEGSETTEPKKKKAKKASVESSIEFINFEDEFFYKNAEIKFSFDVTEATGLAVSGSWDFDDQPMKSLRTVMLLHRSKWKDSLGALEEAMAGELTYED